MIRRICDICGKNTGNISFKIKRRITSPGEKFIYPNSSWVRIDVCEDCYCSITNPNLSNIHQVNCSLASIVKNFDNDILNTEDPDIKMTPKTYELLKKLYNDLTDILERSNKSENHTE